MRCRIFISDTSLHMKIYVLEIRGVDVDRIGRFGRILLIDPKEDSVASETDTALFERAVFRIFIIENAVQQFRIGNSGQNFLQQALCPLYLRSSSIVGSKRQACKALLVHPAYHRADTRVRQDSISRTWSFRGSVSITRQFPAAMPSSTASFIQAAACVRAATRKRYMA